ncbi:hypothetical protein D9599_08095 [Roseomonas sp. KE2513]|nr:hypothetical protein [Roseomonas sp. KE2513]
MLDLSAILFTTILCVFIAVRAVILDSKIPWFSQPQPEEMQRKTQEVDEGWRRKHARTAGAARGER